MVQIIKCHFTLGKGVSSGGEFIKKGKEKKRGKGSNVGRNKERKGEYSNFEWQLPDIFSELN